MKVIPKAVTLMFLVALTPVDVFAMGGTGYESTACDYGNGTFGIRFATRDKRGSKIFWIDFEKKDLVINAKNATGIVKWIYVRRFVYEEKEYDRGYFRIEFREPIYFSTILRRSQIEFGLLSKTCWDRLVTAVDSHIDTKFVPSSI